MCEWKFGGIATGDHGINFALTGKEADLSRKQVNVLIICVPFPKKYLALFQFLERDLIQQTLQIPLCQRIERHELAEYFQTFLLRCDSHSGFL